MGTTLIIVELVIIGFQVLVWVALLLWPVLDSECILDRLRGWVPVVAIGGLAVSYTVGLVFDRSVGLLTQKIDESRWFNTSSNIIAQFGRWVSGRSKVSDTNCDESWKKEKDKIWKMRSYILLHHPEAHKYLENLGRQTRLLRATCLNGAIALIVLLALLVRFRYDLPWVVWPLLVMLMVGAFLTWMRSQKDYPEAVKRLREQADPAARLGSERRPK